MDRTRREFIKLMGGTLCGVMLSQYGCRGSNNQLGDRSPLPNGYRFYRLFSTGDDLPGSGEAFFLPPSVKINEKNQIIFHAGDGLNRTSNGLGMGLYELEMDYNSFQPRIVGRHRIVRVGDRLKDGKEVFQVGLADLNSNGSVAVQLHNFTEPSHSLYLERSRSNGSSANGLQRVLGYSTPTPDGENIFGAALGNFDLHDNDNILVVSHWGSGKNPNGGESVFHLPSGVVDSQGTVLMTTGDLLPQSSHEIKKFGLLHGYKAGGDFALQVHTGALSSGNANEQEGSAVLKVKANGSGQNASLVAASHNIARTASRKMANALPTGTVNLGPRINADGAIAVVTHFTGDDMRLTLDSDRIAGYGDSTPAGKTISGMGGPVLGAKGLVFFVVGTPDGSQELLVSNGSKTASVLTTGQSLFGSEGPKLLAIAFGYSKEQVDSQGRLVFVGEFEDKTLSIILGIPI